MKVLKTNENEREAESKDYAILMHILSNEYVRPQFHKLKTPNSPH